MRRAIVAAVSCLTFLVILLPGGNAYAGIGRSIEATVTVGHPGTVLGLTEAEFYASDCTEVRHQGLDGYVIDLGYGTATLSLSANRDREVLFAHVVFYEQTFRGCRYRQGYWNQDLPIQSHLVPPGSRWAVVSFPYGYHVDFYCSWI